MAVISSRTRLSVAFDQAVSAANVAREEMAADFAKNKKTWKRVTGKRQRWERRISERIAAIDAAIAAIQAAASKL